MFTTEVIPYKLRFRKPAGTSRGVYQDHMVWYVLFRDSQDPSHYGIGECAPLPDLSCDFDNNYAETLATFCRITEETQQIDINLLRNYPSILFGLETAARHYRQHSLQLWDTPFSRGEEGININGLIWMEEYDNMKRQALTLTERGFRCIKLKIGAIDFEQELELLQFIRNRFPADQMTLRVDANGAFDYNKAQEKLQRLANLKLHSIEQPIRAGQWKEMTQLCASSPLSIALDEELIGINNTNEKKNLLDAIRPQYLILKPTLHGGIYGCNEWITLAEVRQIGWWITSALESNIGLNSIAQWCATLGNSLPQGLGTGTLYSNNIPLPLEIRNDQLWYNPQGDFPDKHLREYE